MYMTRQIKFRAWEKKTKRMTVVDVIKFALTGRVKRVHEYTSEISSTSYDVKDIELMQYTGLKDKNGKEIYEGDVVEVEDYSNGAWFGRPQPTKRQEVYYCDEDGEYPFNGTGKFVSNKTEVIGNIYENPELTNTPL